MRLKNFFGPLPDWSFWAIFPIFSFFKFEIFPIFLMLNNNRSLNCNIRFKADIKTSIGAVDGLSTINRLRDMSV